MDKGAETLIELELLKMILYAGSPRRDTKPLAKDMIRHFGSLSAVLRAPQAQLIALDGVCEAAISTIRIVEAAGLHLSPFRYPQSPDPDQLECGAALLYDHLIVAGQNVVSFKNLGLL